MTTRSGAKNQAEITGRLAYGWDGFDAYPLAVVKQGGKGVLTTSPFELEAARGNIPGVVTVNKFGRNIEIDGGVTADIWDGGHTLASGGSVSLIWVAPTAANKHNIASSSASDDGDPGGVGARTIRVFGLPDWDSPEVSEDVTMNGQSNVAMTTDMVIIHRMFVLTKGATSSNVGIITATATAPSATTVTAQIRVGQGQTQMVVYGVPSTQTLFIARLYANVNKAPGAAALVDVALLYNPEADVELTNFLVRHTFGLQTVGTSALTINYGTPKTLPGPAIVKLQALSGTNDVDISGGFDGFVIDS